MGIAKRGIHHWTEQDYRFFGKLETAASTVDEIIPKTHRTVKVQFDGFDPEAVYGYVDAITQTVDMVVVGDRTFYNVGALIADGDSFEEILDSCRTCGVQVFAERAQEFYESLKKHCYDRIEDMAIKQAIQEADDLQLTLTADSLEKLEQTLGALHKQIVREAEEDVSWALSMQDMGSSLWIHQNYFNPENLQFFVNLKKATRLGSTPIAEYLMSEYRRACTEATLQSPFAEALNQIKNLLSRQNNGWLKAVSTIKLMGIQPARILYNRGTAFFKTDRYIEVYCKDLLKKRLLNEEKDSGRDNSAIFVRKRNR